MVVSQNSMRFMEDTDLEAEQSDHIAPAASVHFYMQYHIAGYVGDLLHIL
jgi:hypothetical protein